MTFATNERELTQRFGFDILAVDRETYHRISQLSNIDKITIATTLILKNYSLYFTAATPNHFFPFPLDIAFAVKKNVEMTGKAVNVEHDHDNGLGEKLPWPVGALLKLHQDASTQI